MTTIPQEEVMNKKLRVSKNLLRIKQFEEDQLKENTLEQKILRNKERIWMKQYNDNFKRYKDIVKQSAYERDSSMLDDMSRESTVKANRKFIYNNFPLILGIIFVIFGLIIFFLSSDDKPVQVVPPQINPVFIRMPEKSPTNNLDDLPPEFFNALAQPQQSGQPINIPINVTTGATGAKGKQLTKNKNKNIKKPEIKKDDMKLLFQ
jgi:hypothetical protein